MLNDAQKEYIKSAISHLIDFPNDAQTLSIEIAKLNEALSENKQNDYTILSECLRNPEKFFPKTHTYVPVENEADAAKKTANPVTYDDIQTYIIDLITENIQEAAKKADVSLTENIQEGIKTRAKKNSLIWNKKNILSLFLYKSFPPNKPFQTNDIAVNSDVNLLWKIDVNDDRNYTATLVPSPNTNSVDIKLFIELPNKPAMEGTTKFASTLLRNVNGSYVPRTFQNDRQENDYIQSLKLSAAVYAETLAAEIVFNYLSNIGIINFTELLSTHHVKKKVEVTHTIPDGIKRLLTNKSFVSLLENKIVSYHEIKTITVEEAEMITHPNVISLLKKKLFLLQKILSYVKNPDLLHILMIPDYAKLIELNPILLGDFAKLKSEQLKLFVHPFVVTMLAAKKIRHEEVADLPFAIKKLFDSQFYRDRINREDIDWNKLGDAISFFSCDFLLDKKVIRYCSENNLSLNNLDTIVADILAIIYGKERYKVIAKNHFFLLHAIRYYCEYGQYIATAIVNEKITESDAELYCKKFGIPLAELVISDKVKYSDADLISDKRRKELESSPFLYEFVMQEMIDGTTLSYETTPNLICMAFTNRLIALYELKPFIVFNHSDSITRLCNEINDVKNMLELNQLKEKAISELLIAIKRDTSSQMAHTTSSKYFGFYNDITKFLNEQEKLYPTNPSSNFWQNCLFLLIQLADQLRSNLSNIIDINDESSTYFNHHSFFSGRKKEHQQEDLEKFCQSLNQFLPLCAPIQEQREVIQRRI
ncbi:MAG: hypothetical protein ACD_46C00042G0001 [uncultured bacterium]|nr:MAG: hypothetical protein ACD_46C00042G0001 [uncultured bacterium]